MALRILETSMIVKWQGDEGIEFEEEEIGSDDSDDDVE